MHYIAPGKKNLVYHLAFVHKIAWNNKVTVQELEQAHKELHEEEEWKKQKTF